MDWRDSEANHSFHTLASGTSPIVCFILFLTHYDHSDAKLWPSDDPVNDIVTRKYCKEYAGLLTFLKLTEIFIELV